MSSRLSLRYHCGLPIVVLLLCIFYTNGLSSSSMKSGGDQYIHNRGENQVRQNALHECFRHTSADAWRKANIIQQATVSKEPVRILEIGCGAGLTTIDLARVLIGGEQDTSTSSVNVVAIDTNPELIHNAQENVLQNHPDLASSIEFAAKSGEDAAQEWEGGFDAVWMRFVLVHVPNPIKLVQAASACLKPGGTLLIEDCDATGFISDPPMYVNTLFHEAHIQTSLKLNADIRRGPLIGGYLMEAGMRNIQCDSFIPLFGTGPLTLTPWCGKHETALGPVPSTEEHFELGLKLCQMSLESLTPKFLEMNVCTREELERAHESLATVKDAEYQVFSLPGGKIFQWWGQKA